MVTYMTVMSSECGNAIFLLMRVGTIPHTDVTSGGTVYQMVESPVGPQDQKTGSSDCK